MQNTFSQSGNDSKWFLTKIIFQNRYVALETPPPPFMANAILNFHFDYLNPSLSWTQPSGPLCLWECLLEAHVWLAFHHILGVWVCGKSLTIWFRLYPPQAQLGPTLHYLTQKHNISTIQYISSRRWVFQNTLLGIKEWILERSGSLRKGWQ